MVSVRHPREGWWPWKFALNLPEPLSSNSLLFFFFFSLAFIYFAQFSPLTPQAALTSSVIVLLPGFTLLLLRGFSSCVVFFTPQKCLRQSKPGPAALPRQTRSWVGITPRLRVRQISHLSAFGVFCLAHTSGSHHTPHPWDRRG